MLIDILNANVFASAVSDLRISLETVQAPNQLIEDVVREANTSFRALLVMSGKKHSPEILEAEIRYFLKKRWDYIKYSCADYLNLPYSPINQLCIKLAQKIVKKDEPLIKVLMPSIQVDDYGITGENLIELTEIIDSSGQRNLRLCDFILSENGRAIIPIHQWFDAKIRSGENPFNHHLYLENNKLIPLTPNELNALKRCLPPYSLVILYEFEQRESLLKKPGTLAAALTELVKQLKTNREPGNGGTETVAGPIAMAAIRRFLPIWKQLPSQVKDRLGNLPGNRGNTLSWHLRLLESGVDYSIPLIEREKFVKFGTCVVINGSVIDGILHSNFRDFADIIIDENSIKKAESNNMQSLPELLSELKEALVEKNQTLKNAMNLNDYQAMINLCQPGDPLRNTELRKRIEYFNYCLDIGLSDTPITCLDDLISYANHYPSGQGDVIEKLGEDSILSYFREAILFQNEHLINWILVEKPSLGKRVVDQYYFNQIEIIEMLVRNGLKLSDFSDDERKELFDKALRGNMPLITQIYLNEHPEAVNQKDKYGCTLLHNACEKGAGRVAAMLLSLGADINAKDHHGETPLQLQLCSPLRNPDLIANLIAEGADINIQMYKLPLLSFAADCKLDKVVDALIARKVNVNEIDRYGETPLHHACTHGSVSIATALLQNGAMIDAKNHDGKTPLQKALEASSTNDELPVMLIKKGAGINFKIWQRSLLSECAKYNLINASEALIARKVDINEQDGDRKTALHYASERGNSEMIQFLVLNGANVNIKDNLGKTVLENQQEKAFPDPKIINILIRAGAELSYNKHYIPLYQKAMRRVTDPWTGPATQESWAEVINALETCSIDVNEKDADGKTPLNNALDNTNIEHVHLLMRKGARMIPLTRIAQSQPPAGGRSRTIHPLMSNTSQDETVLGTLAEVLDYAIQKDYSISNLRALFPDSTRINELYSMKSLDILLEKLDLGINNCDTPSQKLMLYACVTACRHEKTDRADPSYLLKQRKATRLREAIAISDDASIFKALKMPDIQTNFWQRVDPTINMPVEISAYYREIEATRVRSNCIPYRF